MGSKVMVTSFTVLMALLMSMSSAWKKDVTIKYYADQNFTCTLNDTELAPNTEIYWITPDSTVISSSTPMDKLPKNIYLEDGSETLKIVKVDDYLFGYYTCFMINPADKSVTVAMWGLNIDGADFSELAEQYRQNAIIGGVAAAVMLVLVGGSCLVWHFRYQRHQRLPSDDDSVEKLPGYNGSDNSAFQKSNDDINLSAITVEEKTQYSNGGDSGTKDQSVRM